MVRAPIRVLLASTRNTCAQTALSAGVNGENLWLERAHDGLVDRFLTADDERTQCRAKSGAPAKRQVALVPEPGRV